MLAWIAWQAPARAPEANMVRTPIPKLPDSALEPESTVAETTMWRIVTRRVVSKAAFTSLKRKLEGMHLAPVTIKNQEDVTMHAFDDAILFKTSSNAWKASHIWKSHQIESTVIKVEDAGVYLVGLGRFFQAKYAEGVQKRLEKTGRKYRYQKRTVPIPTWRFTFSATDKQQAQDLWKKLHDTGVIMPVLIAEDRFQELYMKRKESEVVKR